MKYLHLFTKRMFNDITLQVAKEVKKVVYGFVVVHSFHTTAGVRVIENEKYLRKDLQIWLSANMPSNAEYFHDQIHKRKVPTNERKNAYSHIRHLVGNTSEIIPVIGGKLQLGRWQRIIFLEFDIGRPRKVGIYDYENHRPVKK